MQKKQVGLITQGITWLYGSIMFAAALAVLQDIYPYSLPYRIIYAVVQQFALITAFLGVSLIAVGVYLGRMQSK